MSITETVADEVEGNETTALKKRAGSTERRWFLIALFAFVLLFYIQGGSTFMIFEVTTEEFTGEGMVLLYGSVIIAVVSFFVPLLFKRVGILDELHRVKRLFVVLAVIASASFIAYSAYCAVNPLTDKILPELILQVIIIAVPSVMAGCSMHHAVKTVNIRAAALFPGLVMVLMCLLCEFDIFFQQWLHSREISWAALLSYYPFIYILLLGIPLVLLLTVKEAAVEAAPKPPAIFADALFGKFMLLSVVTLAMDTFSQYNFYAGGDTYQYGFLFNAFGLASIIPGTLLATWLLRKNKWMPAISIFTLFFCFLHGMSTFFKDSPSIGQVSAIGHLVLGAGNYVFMLFIPLVYCLQRRRSAVAVMGMMSLWTVLGVLFEAIKNQWFPTLLSDTIAVPAFSFVLSIAAVAYLFFLFSENNRVYIDVLVAEFKARDIVQINETVAKADRFEGLGLAPREKEVCGLLLKSLTVRQISGELGLAFATVNGYYRDLYRKLGINSKAELFMRFGAESAPAPEEEKIPRHNR